MKYRRKPYRITAHDIDPFVLEQINGMGADFARSSGESEKKYSKI